MLKACRILLFVPTMFSVALDGLNSHSKQPVPSTVDNDGVKPHTRSQLLSTGDLLWNRSYEVVKPELGDSALFLTPYIETGRIEEGQALAVVPPMMQNVESFAGYLTVNKTAGSNMFFWLFKSQEGSWKERPLVIWLQGGPGDSSLFGLFRELGPFFVNDQRKLVKREYSWNRKYNLVFFDNPVGTGFSFTNEEFGYARDENDVARDLYEAIVQLYKLFPALQKNKLIIAGESYAGKYIPAIGYKIYKNRGSAFKINLAGLMIGNGLTDPIRQIGHASYLHELGLVDDNMRDELTLMEDDIREKIRARKFDSAAHKWVEEMDKIKKVTGLRGLFDFINDDFVLRGPEHEFMDDPKTRKALHVGKKEPHLLDWLVQFFLWNDIMQSVKPWVEELLAAEEFPVMFFCGQLDVAIAYLPSVEFYNSLVWPRAKEYRSANRCQFQVDGEVAGYYKTAGTFTEVLVRNAGHMVPAGQPKWAFELLDRFIKNSFSSKCK